MFLIFWFSNTKQTEAAKFSDDLVGIADRIATNIDHINRLAVKYTRLARRIPALRKSAIRVYKIAKKNPVGKFVAAATINLIPFLAVLPWQTIGVYLSYRDEKSTYRIAQEESEKAAFALQGQLQTQLPDDIDEADLDDEELAA